MKGLKYLFHLNTDERNSNPAGPLPKPKSPARRLACLCMGFSFCVGSSLVLSGCGMSTPDGLPIRIRVIYEDKSNKENTDTASSIAASQNPTAQGMGSRSMIGMNSQSTTDLNISASGDQDASVLSDDTTTADALPKGNGFVRQSGSKPEDLSDDDFPIVFNGLKKDQILLLCDTLPENGDNEAWSKLNLPCAIAAKAQTYKSGSSVFSNKSKGLYYLEIIKKMCDAGGLPFDQFASKIGVKGVGEGTVTSSGMDNSVLVSGEKIGACSIDPSTGDLYKPVSTSKVLQSGVALTKAYKQKDTVTVLYDTYKIPNLSTEKEIQDSWKVIFTQNGNGQYVFSSKAKVEKTEEPKEETKPAESVSDTGQEVNASDPAAAEDADTPDQDKEEAETINGEVFDQVESTNSAEPSTESSENESGIGTGKDKAESDASSATKDKETESDSAKPDESTDKSDEDGKDGSKEEENQGFLKIRIIYE